MSQPAPIAAFTAHTYAQRLDQVRTDLRERDLDALLVFAQESLYYLTGFDTAGYVFFQCAVISSHDTPITLLTRRPDRDQALATSVIDDVRLWYNAPQADPAGQVRDILLEKGLGGRTIGIELDTYGLTGFNYEQVRCALADVCTLVDASSVVAARRLVKSDAEIEHVRAAAAIADEALLASFEAARPGVPDSHVTAACVASMLHNGADMPAGGPLVNSGSRVSFGRGVGSTRELGADDQLIIEFSASYRRYNACLEATVTLGSPSARLSHMHDSVTDALAAMIDTARPGTSIGTIDEVHRRMLDDAGYAEQRFAACGYSLGATFRPTWMDVPPMIYAGNPLTLAPGMVLFLHAIVGDQSAATAAGVGRTIVIGEQGAEVLSRLPVELITR